MQDYTINHSNDITIRSQEAICRIINEAMNNLTIEERFNLIELIKSNDPENMTLALGLIETLSGEELKYIELLYYTLYNKIC